MPQFIATTSKGLVDELANELTELGFTQLKKTPAGVYFESNKAGSYKVNLESRLATRVLKPILDFPAYQPDELYHNIKKHDFTKYIDVNQTMAVDATVKESKMHDQRFVAMKTKDAIVDEFWDKFNARPNVDNDSPDLRVHVRGYKNNFNIAIDTSGHSLFMRGYRDAAGPAPMKEHLAAGLLRLSGWNKQIPVVDLTCGSGTILIEAALMALDVAPGSLRKQFGFSKVKGFDKETWNQVVDESMQKEKQELPFKFYGFDIDKRVLQFAKMNAKNAGVENLIEFRREPIATVTAPCEKGIIIMNPPYGARMGEEDNLRDVYRDLGHTLKTNFKGWEAWILSGNKDLILDMKLKASRKYFVYNGAIECRFLKYEIR